MAALASTSSLAVTAGAVRTSKRSSFKGIRVGGRSVRVVGVCGGGGLRWRRKPQRPPGRLASPRARRGGVTWRRDPVRHDPFV